MNKKLVLVASDSQATMTKKPLFYLLLLSLLAFQITRETRRNKTQKTKKPETEPNKKLVSDAKRL